MMKVAVIGASGQLGSDLCKELSSVELVPLTHSEIEVADIDSVKGVLERYRPDLVINTAAFFPADRCETEPDRSFQVNALGARNVAVVASSIEAKLVFISTDYVFGGEAEPKGIPYTEFDTPLPVNVYGKSKLAGERFVQHLCSRYFIIRSSGFFSTTACRSQGDNFVERILRLARERDELKVVNDQVFSPTYSKDLARKIAQLITTEYYGIFHITSRGACSWYQFASEILRLAGLNTPIVPITSDQYPQKAKRPHFSVLDNYHLQLLGMDDMRAWHEALVDYMKEKGHICNA